MPRPLLALLLLVAPSAVAGDPPRTLKQFYEQRAYAGAPPSYRHELEGDVGWAGDACLSCHKRGSSGAPVTPHPWFGECRMCHVQLKVSTLFRPTDFVSVSPPTRHLRALPSSPMVAAHVPGVFRQRCVVCHTGKNTVKELLSPHPERGACPQCHVPQRTQEEWTRPVPESATPAAQR